MTTQSEYYKLVSPFVKMAVMLALASVSCNSHAITIVGGSYLSQSDAALIDTQIGAGPHDYNNIFTGTTGASASSWHAAVDNVGPTLSIYDIVLSTSQLGGGTTAFS